MARAIRREPVSGRTSTWWDTRLLGLWTAANGLAYLVVVVGGVALEELFAGATGALTPSHWMLATFLVALLGAGLHGSALGILQWRVLRHRLPALSRGRWVVSTFIPAFAVWLLVLAPEAVDTVTGGGNTITAFRDAFVQAMVLGPLIGVAQAMALRHQTRRWKWWFVANLTTCLFGALMIRVGALAVSGLAVTVPVSTAFPLLAFVFHGVWMLWVSDPAVVGGRPRSGAR
jgi:hypothetical protein